MKITGYTYRFAITLDEYHPCFMLPGVGESFTLYGKTFFLLAHEFIMDFPYNVLHIEAFSEENYADSAAFTSQIPSRVQMSVRPIMSYGREYHANRLQRLFEVEKSTASHS